MFLISINGLLAGFKIWNVVAKYMLINYICSKKKILKNKIKEVEKQTNEEHAVISNPELIY
jgi:hypothetical protein